MRQLFSFNHSRFANLSVKFALSLSVFCFGVGNAFAHNPQYTIDLGPVGITRGGAVASTATDIESINTNPAGLAYSFGSRGIGGFYQQTARSENKWGVGAIDGYKGFVTGLYFDWFNRNDMNRLGFNMGTAYKTDYGAFGASLSLYRFDDLPSGNGYHFSNSFGVLTPVLLGFIFGASAKGFLDRARDSSVPPQVLLGLSYTYSGAFIVSAQTDRRFKIDDQKWNYSFGGDLIFKKFYALRGGYRWDNSGEYDYWSAGLAVSSPTASLSGFFQRTVSGSPSNGFGFEIYSSF